MALFGKRKYTPVRIASRREIPDGLWTKCSDCGEIIYNKSLEENLLVCPSCQYHFPMNSSQRIAQIIDEGTFLEHSATLVSKDPLGFKGPKDYADKVVEDRKATGLKDAVVTGAGKINGLDVSIGVTDSRFMMGSMGSVVGEKLSEAIEFALEKRLPVVIVSGSGGGARMQEGMLSLMQMAKTSAALARLHQSGLLFISVLTNPTMAGVMASFAALGDVILAEPRALIGFTGPRVIEQTIRQKLPEGFQRSEFLVEHGMLDRIVHRKDLKQTLAQLIDYLKN